jgi:drug/metabolite transporter (DMT)-like permease
LKAQISNLAVPASRGLSVVYGKLFLTALFWGGTFIAGRQVAQDLGPFSIAFLRFAVACVLLLGLARIQEGRFPHVDLRQIPLVLLLGLSGVFAYNALFFKGLHLIEAGRAALIIATCPAFIAVASALLLRERLTRIQGIGIPLSILGAAVVISKGDLHQIVTGGIGPGELFILGCVLSWTAYSLLGRVALRRLSPLACVSYSSLAGALVLAIPALYEGLPHTLRQASGLDWTSIAYLAVFGTVLGFVWYYQGVRLIGATRAGLFINFVPISAVLLGFLLLGEPVTWSLAVGAVLVLSGVSLANKASPNSGPQPPSCGE